MPVPVVSRSSDVKQAVKLIQFLFSRRRAIPKKMDCGTHSVARQTEAKALVLAGTCAGLGDAP